MHQCHTHRPKKLTSEITFLLLHTGSGLKRNKWNFCAPFCTWANGSLPCCSQDSVSLPPHPCHVLDGWVIACLLRAATWLQPWVERIWPFLHIALNVLDNPEMHVEMTKPHLRMMEVRRSPVPLLTLGGFVLCPRAVRNALVLHGRCEQLSTVSFQNSPEQSCYLW